MTAASGTIRLLNEATEIIEIGQGKNSTKYKKWKQLRNHERNQIEARPRISIASRQSHGSWEETQEQQNARSQKAQYNNRTAVIGLCDDATLIPDNVWHEMAVNKGRPLRSGIECLTS